MKDFTKEQWEEGRPKIPAVEGIEFSLACLYRDIEREAADIVAGGMTYEELIGVLLVARDELERINGLEEEIERLEQKLDDSYGEDQ